MSIHTHELVLDKGLTLCSVKLFLSTIAIMKIYLQVRLDTKWLQYCGTSVSHYFSTKWNVRKPRYPLVVSAIAFAAAAHAQRSGSVQSVFVRISFVVCLIINTSFVNRKYAFILISDAKPTVVNYQRLTILKNISKWCTVYTYVPINITSSLGNFIGWWWL